MNRFADPRKEVRFIILVNGLLDSQAKDLRYGIKGYQAQPYEPIKKKKDYSASSKPSTRELINSLLDQLPLTFSASSNASLFVLVIEYTL